MNPARGSDPSRSLGDCGSTYFKTREEKIQSKPPEWQKIMLAMLHVNKRKILGSNWQYLIVSHFSSTQISHALSIRCYPSKKDSLLYLVVDQAQACARVALSTLITTTSIGHNRTMTKVPTCSVCQPYSGHGLFNSRGCVSFISGGTDLPIYI